MEQGTLMVATEYHKREAFAELWRTYGTSRVGRDGAWSGWLSDNAQDLQKVRRGVSACALCRPAYATALVFTPTDPRLPLSARCHPPPPPAPPKWNPVSVNPPLPGLRLNERQATG